MKPTLVVLAAGMGSRYGGIKQIEGVGPNNESLIDYSIYNALKAGFGKIVMVIRKDIKDAVEEFFKDKIPSSVPIEWVFQELDNLPSGYSVPAGREKPWGTGHAVLICKDAVKEPFAMINGDDYYAYEALKETADFLTSVNPTSPEYVIIGYELKNTLSPFGSVSRGICQVDDKGLLVNLQENKKIVIDNAQNKIISEHESDASKNVVLTGKEPASMNLFGFTPNFFSQLETGFTTFLHAHAHTAKEEFYVPAYLGELVSKNLASARVLTTNAQWFGITYQADKPTVQKEIALLVEKGIYKSPLW